MLSLYLKPSGKYQATPLVTALPDLMKDLVYSEEGNLRFHSDPKYVGVCAPARREKYLFHNVLRGVHKCDENAAEMRTIEMTTRIQVYLAHSSVEILHLYDLPGYLGTQIAVSAD